MKLQFIRIREATSDIVANSPERIVSMMAHEALIDRECFWVLHLNVRNGVIEKELVSMGTLDSTLVHSREVFKKAVLYGAAGIVTVHNHPSGATNPSKEDRSLWRSLDYAGDVLGIPVLDHIIITPNGEFYSHKHRR